MSRSGRLTEAFFLATAFSVTFEKLHWGFAANVTLADVLTILFVVSFAADRIATGDGRLPATAGLALVFAAALLVVYLLGYFNLETHRALVLFGKGLVKFGLHFAFLVAAVALLVRRTPRFYWQALAAVTLGMTANAAYGVIQLAAARAGVNLDARILSPLTGGASAINIYGYVGEQSVYRPNALTGDPNHLGIMLLVPLLILTPIYLRLERAHPLKVPLAALLAFLLVVELATLSRSGLLGLGVGILVLLVPYRRLFLSRAALIPLSAVAVVVAWIVSRRLDFFETVLRERIATGGRSTSPHFGVYGLVPDVLASNPLFGLGLNTFSVYYEFVTGKTNWGPHSFYVALLVETGLVGTILFALFLWFLFARLRAARALGRALAAAREPLAARVRPLAWGLTAALVGTMAANAFYLTMQFYYFYALAALALAAAPVFRRTALRT